MTGPADGPGTAPEDSVTRDGRASQAASPSVAVLVAAGLVVVIDVLTKAWAVEALVGEPIDLVWTFRLSLVENTGVAFGAGRGLGPVLAVVAVAVCVVLWRIRHRFTVVPGPLALGMVLGGAVGNLLDRVLRGAGWGRGAVIDFIDVQFWPVFNVADIGISVGVPLLLLAAWRADRQGLM